MPYADPKKQAERGAASFRKRYSAKTAKGKAFRKAEKERKAAWQATPEGQAQNRERVRRFRERMKLGKRMPPVVKQGNTQPSRSSRQRATGGKVLDKNAKGAKDGPRPKEGESVQVYGRVQPLHKAKLQDETRWLGL
jgi:hypothetical protein